MVEARDQLKGPKTLPPHDSPHGVDRAGSVDGEPLVPPGPSASPAPATRAAGGVVLLRRTESGARVAVVEGGGLFSLPRAEVGIGEGAEAAAERAAIVFLGVDVRLVASAGETQEIVDGVEILTWFWTARTRRQSRRPLLGPPPAGFAVHWLDAEEAVELLDSEDESRMLARLGSPPLRRRRRPLATAEHRALRHDIESLRDTTITAAETHADGEARDALFRARVELERAEERLARDEDAAARRAYARAERGALAVLHPQARNAALLRALGRLSPAERDALGVRAPVAGEAVPLDEALTAQGLVQVALEERVRLSDERRTGQLHAALALGTTAIAIVVAASVDLFQVPLAGEPGVDPTTLATAFLAAGALGGWTGEALWSLRDDRPARTIWLPLTAGLGAVAGLVLGAFVTEGLSNAPNASHAALALGGAFAAGWISRRAVPRRRENSAVDPRQR